MTKKIFTTSFFQLSPRDQAAVVDAEIRNLECQTYLTPEGEKNAKRRIRRITKKAEEYGIYAPEAELDEEKGGDHGSD